MVERSRGQGIEHHLHFIREQRQQGRAAAFVRYMHHVDTRHRLEELGAEVNAGPRRAVVELAGLRLGERDQLGGGPHLDRRMHREQIRPDRDRRHRREIPHRVELRRGQGDRIDHVRSRGADGERGNRDADEKAHLLPVGSCADEVAGFQILRSGAGDCRGDADNSANHQGKDLIVGSGPTGHEKDGTRGH